MIDSYGQLINMGVTKKEILRVYRTKEQAKRTYDRISRIYDLVAEPFESKFRDMALEQLDIRASEAVLEVGFGTGHSLEEIAKRVGEDGRVYGIDISSGMLKMTKERLRNAGLADRLELCCGDAMSMPYKGNMFSSVFMSFTLELFDTPEIPAVLKEIRRVLRPGGKLGVVSMSRENGKSALLKAYEWVHTKFPAIADCRPIYVEQSIKDCGYQIKYKGRIGLFGLPGEIVIAES